jgi:ligand-binding sensor domain-containing protein/signal transduction histidine kinase/DNA-binding response OmpR family regulator
MYRRLLYNMVPGKDTRNLLMIFWCLAFLSPGMACHGDEPVSRLQFDQITSIQGLSNNTVYDITQDKEGFIWIGTREGLNKYDGQVIKSYYQSDLSGLPGNFIEQLLSSTTDRLFAGTQKGVGIYDQEKDRFSALLYQQRSLGDVFRIIELSSKDILISTSEGLFLVDEDLDIWKISPYEFTDLCEFRTGIIWGLHGDEILVMNTQGEIIRRYTDESESTERFDMSSSNIECMYKDSRDIVWLGTKRDGIGYYNHETDKFFSLKLEQGVNPVEDNFIRVINEDATGRLWIGTESGLYIYDVESESFTFYGQCFIPTDKGLNDKAIYSVFRSRDDLMWIGTYFGGVNYTSLYRKGFSRIYADGGQKGLSGNAVSEIIESSDGRLWIGTEDGGISILDPERETFEYLKHVPGNPGSLSSNNVHALEEDEEGNIWIGTFLGGLNRFNRRTGSIEKIELVPPIAGREEDVYSKSLFSIYIDSEKRIWVGSIEGLYMREKENDDFKIWNPQYFQDNFIYHIEEDHSHNLWICTYEQGIFRIDTLGKVSNFRTGSNHDILSNRIVFCHMDSTCMIWFGTVEGGLLRYNMEKNNFKSYTRDDGLPNNTVYAITKDRQGDLWLSTNKGISRFDPEQEVFVNYTENDGLVGNQFNFKSGLITSNGIMYFGAVNGLTYFNPEKLSIDYHEPDLHFTDLKISNTSVKIEEDGILSSQIDFQKEIHLKYQHKVFTIEYVGLNYLSPKNIEYAYYLEGLENDWNYVGNRRSATYTNLSPGRYVFHLKAANGDQVWSESERAIIIDILPPFWISTWGFMLYGIILISTTLLIVRFYMVRQKEKMNVRLARMEKQKNEEISRHRLNFFTYISHEFKTPLTLIIATLEHLMNYEDILPKFKNYGMLMRKNAMRLLFLINQLMDFRRIETDHAALKYNRGDVIGFIRSTFEAFNPLMEKLSIKGKFTANVDSYIVYFEADKLEKILTNLISNSCKSFKKPGTISVDVKISERSHLAHPSPQEGKTGDLIISILDDGPGLPRDKLQRMLEPFESSDPSDFYSSGLGLSLVHSLVKYLNGQISVSNPAGGGSSIQIQLPLVYQPSPELIKDDSFIESNAGFNPEYTSVFTEDESQTILDLQEDGSAREYEILVVEDNRELAIFLRHHFAGIFKVQIAFDGIEALERIKKTQPDLIISDIMMPRMDGYALCNAVKDSLETCHIPVILLTSKSGEEAKLEGFFKGADAYIGKPFNIKEMDLQVRNILRAKENFRRHFAKFETLQESVSRLNNKDQMFIRRLTETVLRHLDDGTFNVDKFCYEVHISRTLLHIKLKKITGMSTTEFIRNVRLHEARKMLQEGSLTVSEIAYRVGFNDPAYFSKSYKKKFGKMPSSVLKEV